MPPILRKESIKSGRTSLGFQKKKVQVSGSLSVPQSLKVKTSVGSVDKNETLHEKKPSVVQNISPVEQKASNRRASDRRASDRRASDRRVSTSNRSPPIDRRRSSVVSRRSTVSNSRVSIKDASLSIDPSKDANESRVSKTATDVTQHLNINDPVAFSYQSFSDTDSIRNDEGARKLGPAIVSTESRYDKPVHRLSKVDPIDKKKSRKKEKEKLPDVISLEGSFDASHGTTLAADKLLEHSKSSSLLKKDQDDESVEKDENSSEDFGSPSIGESKVYLLDSQIEEIEAKMDFFETLGQIPSIDKISLDSSIKKFFESSRESISLKFDEKDLGKFVNPLTGSPISSSSSGMFDKFKRPPGELSKVSLKSRKSFTSDMQDEDIEELEEEEEVEAESPFIPNEPEEDDELLTVVGLDSDEEIYNSTVDEKPAEATAMDIYLHQQKHVLLEEALKAAAESVEDEEVVALRENIVEFFDHIIKKVVAKVESVRPAKLLRKTLDKKALMGELIEKLYDLDIEKKAHLYLNHRIVDYYRHKNSYRNIVEDSLETTADTKEKYKEALTKLDVAITKEEELEISAAIETDASEKRLQEAEEIARESYNNFETLIRETMTKENYNSLNSLVNTELEKMAAVRDQISETRVTLIERQHLLARLKEQNDKMESIGDGLTVAKYENLQEEITMLDKKLEERNIELNRLRNYTTTGIHMITHLREKEKMIRNTIAVRQSCLDDLLDEKADCRKYINRAQKQRKKLRKDIGHVIFQGGLHGKPDLMADYDETVERIEKHKKRIAALKQKISMMLNRIDVFESRISLRNPNEDSTSKGSLKVLQSLQKI